MDVETRVHLSETYLLERTGEVTQTSTVRPFSLRNISMRKVPRFVLTTATKSTFKQLLPLLQCSSFRASHKSSRAEHGQHLAKLLTNKPQSIDPNRGRAFDREFRTGSRGKANGQAVGRAGERAKANRRTAGRVNESPFCSSSAVDVTS